MPAERFTRSQAGRDHDHAPSQQARAWLVCHVCNETFKRTEHLTRHARKHTGEKPFACASCNKSFNRADSLKRHELLHTGPRARQGDLPSQLELPAPATNSVDQVSESHPVTNDSGRIKMLSQQQWVSQDLPHVSILPPGPDPGHNEHAVDHNSYHSNQWSLDASNRALDPGVMSNTNWLPLAEIDDLDWNPFSLFLDSTFPAGQDPASFYNTTTMQHASAPIATQQPRSIGTGSSFAVPSPNGSQAFTGESPQSTGPALSSVAIELDPSAATYVDSGVTRLPKGRKRTTSVHHGPAGRVNLRPSRGQYGFTNTDHSAEDAPRLKFTGQGTYDSIMSAFRKTCSNDQSSFEPFTSTDFLSINDIDNLVNLAAEHFLPSMPFLNRSMLAKDCSWILCLALATTGAHYESCIEEQKVFGLTEFLRRVILLAGETFPVAASALDLVQAKLLLCICLLYSGRRRYRDKGRVLLGDISQYCRQQDDLAAEQRTINFSDRPAAETESRIRTKHAIWLLDCMAAYQHDIRPVLSNEDADTPLPISDTAWDILVEEPSGTRSSCAQTPSLRQAIGDLYLDKAVHPAVGEFGRVLLIHALFRQTWHVLKTSKSTLSTWEPQQKSFGMSPEGDDGATDEWAPLNPAFARWRNAACDCIDVLHWHANSQIGANSGSEHPTVFFLHLSRIVLLSPIDKICNIVLGLVGDMPITRTKAESAVHDIFRWAHEDCYKARLAQIHAGVLLYHVRRHSLDSFYEPNAVFSAILCLWAYGCAYQKSASMSASRAETPGTDDGGVLPSFIHLDRPCDDELVQLFITNGNKVVPNVTGVGDICAIGGPKRTLKLGCSLLRTFKRNWDLKSKYTDVLARLGESTNLFESAVRQM